MDKYNIENIKYVNNKKEVDIRIINNKDEYTTKKIVLNKNENATAATKRYMGEYDE
jgi:hypothetical protein